MGKSDDMTGLQI